MKRRLEPKAVGEDLDPFQVLADRLLNTAKCKTECERLSTLPQLEKTSWVLSRAARLLFGEVELVEEEQAGLDVAALWAAVEEVAPRAAVVRAAETVVTLVDEDGTSAEIAMWAALTDLYVALRPFPALLGESKGLDSASTEKRVLAGGGFERWPGGRWVSNGWNDSDCQVSETRR
ncbi:hypothetical protein GTY69_16715 [Streptomyces sp. SID8364]|nr:hypothetical protein [Streptomyces sp. MnatMP-M77]MYT79286.1 hypothetical protein [Streptomyces sp. SID8364]